MMDQEVSKAIVRTSGRILDPGVVSEAEEFLEQPTLDCLYERRGKARGRVEDALREWLEATKDWLHQTSEPGP